MANNLHDYHTQLSKQIGYIIKPNRLLLSKANQEHIGEAIQKKLKDTKD